MNLLLDYRDHFEMPKGVRQLTVSALASVALLSTGCGEKLADSLPAKTAVTQVANRPSSKGISPQEQKSEDSGPFEFPSTGEDRKSLMETCVMLNLKIDELIRPAFLPFATCADAEVAVKAETIFLAVCSVISKEFMANLDEARREKFLEGLEKGRDELLPRLRAIKVEKCRDEPEKMSPPFRIPMPQPVIKQVRFSTDFE